MVGFKVTCAHSEGMSIMLCNDRKQFISCYNEREPTYWPSDRRKIPDVIDFCIVKGISDHYLKAKSCFDLSSDHSPIIVTLNIAIIKKEKPLTLYNTKTNWYYFREILDEEINCKIPLKIHEDIETAIDTLNKTVQKAAWESTPADQHKEATTHCPNSVKVKIVEKRKLRRIWLKTRSSHDKSKLNQATKQLKELISRDQNKEIEEFLEKLTPTEVIDYSL